MKCKFNIKIQISFDLNGNILVILRDQTIEILIPWSFLDLFLN